jgi:hypothetical protein
MKPNAKSRLDMPDSFSMHNEPAPGLLPISYKKGYKKIVYVTPYVHAYLTQERRSQAVSQGNRRRTISRALLRGDKAAIDAINQYLNWFESEFTARSMFQVFIEEDISAAVFWQVFADHWTRCDASYWLNVYFRPLLKRKGPCPVELRDDFWRGLPETFTVYRGTDASRVDGFCWTTEKDTARYFATGGRGGKLPNPVIATGIVNKADVYFATNNRNEREVVCDPVNVMTEGFEQ